MNFNWIVDSVVAQVPTGDPDGIALNFDGEQALTYAELYDKSLRYAAALRELGLEKGDRLALLLFNCPEYVPLYMAAARLGAIPVRMNFRLAAPELGFILKDSGSKLAILHSSLLEKVEPVHQEVDAQRFIALPDSDDPIPSWADPFDVLEGRDPLDPAAAPSIAPGDPLLLAYTSGTTGNPKGAIWTHDNTMQFGAMQAVKWGFTSRSVGLVPGPIYHCGAFEALLVGVLSTHGTAVNIRSGNFSIEHLMSVAERAGATDILLYSFMLNELLRLPDPRAALPQSVERLLVGGDTVMPWAFKQGRELLPGVELFQLYGLTEGGAVTTVLDDDVVMDQPGCIGRPMPFCETKVMTEAGTETAVDEVGELWVRSPAVSIGYWNRPEANAKTFFDGWCKTGDLGSVNADGYIALAGRAKDMIRSGAENIYPAEVEKILTDHEDVSDAAVIGVPDERYIEVGCAVIVPAKGEIDEDALRVHCREYLAGYKIPKHFVTASELPRNASGKVLKYVLKERYAETAAAS